MLFCLGSGAGIGRAAGVAAMTDQEFGDKLAELKRYAAESCDQSFLAGDRERFNLWESRLLHLKSVTFYEDLTKLSSKTAGLAIPPEGPQ
jgi:hypothetical protein